MYRFITLVIVCLLLSWQPLPIRMEVSTSYFPWEPVGPTNLGNILTRGIRVGNKIFVGSAFGGLYESSDGGRSWQVVPAFTLNQNGEAVYRNLSISALAASGDTLYVGTGNITRFDNTRLNFRAVDTVVKFLDTLRGWLIGATGLPGMGVFISVDGGQTFSNQNATWRLSYPNLSYASNYRSNSALTNIVDIAVVEGRVCVITQDSIFLSNDGLQSMRKRGLPVRRPLCSVEWGAENVLFVSTTEKLYRSTDGGNTFTEVQGFRLPPETQFSAANIVGIGGGNVVVRAAPSNRNILYVASANLRGELVGIWASSDNGSTWTLLSSAQSGSFNVLGQVGLSALALRVDPTDPSHILIGGNEVWDFSPATGWQRVSPANQDPFVLRFPNPIRDFVFLDGGEYLVIGNGRLVRVTQRGARLEDANRGIRAAAVLSVAVAPNGDIHASGLSPLNISSHYSQKDPAEIFRLVNFPPGVAFNPVRDPVGNVVVSSRLPEVVGLAYQWGRFRLSVDRGLRYNSVYNPPAPYAFYRSGRNDSIQPPSAPAPERQPPFTIQQDRPLNYGPIYPPIALVESFPEIVRDRNRNLNGTTHLFIATSQHLWYVSNIVSLSPDSLQYWSRVSPTEISNLADAPTYASYFSPSLTIPTAMGVAAMPGEDYTVWIGTSNGRLLRIQKAQDIGRNRSEGFDFEEITPAIQDLVRGRLISAIAVHPKNPNLLAISVGSYASPAERIFLTTNATAENPTFTSIHANLPNIPVFSLFFHPDSSELLLAGTAWGLWRCPRVSTPLWEEMTGEVIGRVPVTCITWKPYRYQIDTVDRSNPDDPLWEARLLPDPERPVYIATWGRGIWKLNSRSVTSLPSAISGRPLRVEAFPNPFSDELTIRVSLPSGCRRMNWRLLTLSGQYLAHHEEQNPLSSGEYTFRWRLPSLAHGTYLLQVEMIDKQGKSHTETIKLLRW
ncbi:MAG: hypothetical protein RMK19_02005 [Bacteroidia bacterium]|nr:hypothetical protein [Bacteroidia bacterium]MDW8014768.1 hypothetical protein [Bacteroidia bacterium]